MFKKTNKRPQLDLFGSSHNVLKGRSLHQYNDDYGWHNQFRKEIVTRVDESLFKVLFSDSMGAPNASVSVLVGMLALKEGFGWSDSQLYEQCRFNILVRSALGLFNLNDLVPTESTYYLFRKRIHQYDRENGENLLQSTFETITRQQVKEFDVNGRSIRMDSKLIGSNIAVFSRYEIIHQSLMIFYKSMKKIQLKRLSSAERKVLKELAKEGPEKTVYRSTKEEIISLLDSHGLLIYKLLGYFGNQDSEAYHLLSRVFHEQYRVAEKQKVILRPREEINSDSLQSPHDPESAYRHKGDQKVKGYTVNVTETVGDDQLNLITNVIVDKANVSDRQFVKPAIEDTVRVTGQPVETGYVDGGYQSPQNDSFCEYIDMVYTGLQGFPGRYELEMTPLGLLVTDTHTGESVMATLARKTKRSKEDRWFINGNEKRIYFGRQAIRASHLRRQLKDRSKEELQRRNNVEATIFQLSYHLRNQKSKYRGLIQQKTWVISRSLWINLIRIINYNRNGLATAQKMAVKLSIYMKMLLSLKNRDNTSFRFIPVAC